jgi:hypothetical protein
MSRRSVLLGFVVALAVLASASALLPNQSRVLVLLDNLSQQHAHSKFFNALRSMSDFSNRCCVIDPFAELFLSQAEAMTWLSRLPMSPRWRWWSMETSYTTI